jgi:flagellar basal-body rod modification protein FlgD
MISKVQSTPADTGNKVPGSTNKLALKTEDFIKMMITQLQQQDPMEPAKNEQLLAQMSQIGQLQSSTQLQESLKGIVQQNQIGAAAGLIGKTIKGLDADDNEVAGRVTSVRVTDDGAELELDNGKALSLSRVTSIATQPAAPAAAAA